MMMMKKKERRGCELPNGPAVDVRGDIAVDVVTLGGGGGGVAPGALQQYSTATVCSSVSA